MRIDLARQFKTISLRSDWAFLLLAPLVAVPLFGICLINQIGFADPWIYTGYARMLGSMVDIYGWQYYSVRFPVIGLISFFATVFKEPLDFVFLRYLIYALVAFTLYRFICKTFSKGAAVAAVVMLVASPQFARILLWDLSSFIAIPVALIGMCLWLIPTPRPIAPRVAAGFMFGVAVNSHVFIATVIAAFLLIQFIMDCCASRGTQFIAGFAWAMLGGAVCLAIGLVYYNLAIRPVGLNSFIAATLFSIRNGLDYHLRNQFTSADILKREFPIYLPLILTAMNGMLLGKRVFSTAISARIFWSSAVYFSFFLLFHFVGDRNILGFFFYTAFMFPILILQIPIVIDELGGSAGPTIGWNAATAFIVCLVIVPLLNNWIPAVSNAFVTLQSSPFAILVILALIVLALALAFASFWSKFVQPVAAALLALFIQVALFSHVWHFQVFSRSRSPREFAVYLAAADLVRLAREYDAPGHRLRIWYSLGDTAMYGMSFMIWGSTVQPPHEVYETGMPSIGESERKVLASPESAYVLLTAPTDDMVEAGIAALRSAGVQFDMKIKTVLGSNSAFQEKAVLVSLHH